MGRKTILDKAQIDLKMQRMALEVAERNTDAERIVLAGIAPNGSLMAAKLKPLIESLVQAEVVQINLQMDKKHPVEVVTDRQVSLDYATLVLVDDVANSGRTLTYALKPFLQTFPARIQTLVLVDRTHKAFPIQPDYVGFSIATTFQEYIDVEVDAGEIVCAWAE
jgi:pyrimidine operon attenuation protein/uracil phosphoribosyltransferase